MHQAEAKKEIERLRVTIEEHNYCYYILSQPKISDKEYDELLRRLVVLEKQFPEFFDINSPSQRVGAKLKTAGITVKHRTKLYSLENTYSLHELRQWYARVEKNLPGQVCEFVAELKIDGISAALTYKDGKFILGATRGDGLIGEDITSNVRTIRCLPLRLDCSKNNLPRVFDIRAEIFMTREDFQQLNTNRKKNKDPIFANPRNATSGTLKLLDPSVASKRMLRCLVHSFGTKEGGFDIKNQWDFFQIAKEYGLPLSPYNVLCKNFEDIIHYCHKFQSQRNDIPYEVDGVVIKVNSFIQQKRLGSTSKSPRWAVAYKFPAQRATTVVKNITIQVGRTGVLTPVAELFPVQCAGVRIARATLHNFEEVQRLGIKINDRVLLERAGDVIPKIVKVTEVAKDGVPVEFPKICPECSEKIFKIKKDEVALRCLNPFCPKQLEKSFLHFASRDAMDIEGLGESVVRALLEKKFIKDFSDLYLLTKDQLLTLPLFQEKKANNLLLNIKKSKNQTLAKLIFAFGIMHIGQKASFLVAQKFKNIDRLMQATVSELISLDEIGEAMANSLYQFLHQPYTKKLIQKLKSIHVNMTQPTIKADSGILSGLRFIFTGELDSLTRSEAIVKVRQLGAQIASNVNKHIDYVVIGQKPGGKYRKAKNLGLRIINEQQFKEMIYGK